MIWYDIISYICMRITGIGIKWGGSLAKISSDLCNWVAQPSADGPRLLDAIKLSGAEEHALATAQSHGTKRGDQKRWETHVAPRGDGCHLTWEVKIDVNFEHVGNKSHKWIHGDLFRCPFWWPEGIPDLKMGKHTNYFMRKLLDIAGFSWYLHVIFHSEVDKPFGMFFFFSHTSYTIYTHVPIKNTWMRTWK